MSAPALLGTVLVVDDHAPNRELLAAYLASVPCAVEEAVDGESALARVAAAPPDLILLDVMMPGLDGYTVTERLKANPRTATIPVVLVTALQDRADRLRGLEAGADEFLSRPVDRVELVVRVRTLLRLKRLRDEREAQQEAERARLAGLVDYLPDGVLLFEGADARLMLANLAANTTLGWPLAAGEAFAAQSVCAHFLRPDGSPYPPEALPHMRALRTGVASIGEELIIEQADGRRVPLLVSSAPIPQPASAAPLVVMVCQDISRLKEVEQRQAEFVAVASHELRTPMTSLVGFTELLLHRDVADATRRVWLQTMHQEGLRLAGILNDLLDLSRLDSGHLQLTLAPQRVDAAIDQALKTLGATTSRHTLVAAVEPGLPRVLADADKLQQILVNLVGNAIKYSPNGGRVLVEARRLNGEEIEIRVSDEGIGIPPEEVPRLFTRFHRVRRPETEAIEGTGLGLAVTKELVERHRGRIAVTSTPGQGTEVAFTLPLMLEGPAPAPPRPLVLVVARAAPGPAEALCARLDAAGYDARWVRSTAELREEAAARPPAAVVIALDSDAVLDSWEALAMLRAEPSTAAVAVLLVADWDSQPAGRTLGATEYLVKPVRPQELLAVLRRLTQPAAGPILAVDDDAATRALLAATLRGQGFPVVLVASGVEALARVEAELPAAIILDLLMPGMDGFEVLERLRTNPRTQQVPVVVFTAKELSPQEKHWLHERSAALLRKAPHATEDLLAALRRAVPVGQPADS